MKGLLKAFGLIVALFVSNNVQASIYDTSTYQQPSSESVTTYYCRTSSGRQDQFGLPTQGIDTLESCMAKIRSLADYLCSIPQTSGYHSCSNFQQISTGVAPDINYYLKFSYCYSTTYCGDKSTTLGPVNSPETVDSISCPPDSYPNYIYPYDFDGNGTPEKCYDPIELDNVSKCADLFNSGSVLSTGSNVAPLVCKVFEDGSRCAFSRVNQGTTPYYQPNLEESCFGDGDEIPEYDPDPNDPQPQPEQCVPYAGGYACAADPNNYCSSEFECVDGCGYFNGQFICFRDEQCTGASCEPAPVDCTTVPDAPVCKDKETTPEPTFCEKNPTVQACQGGSDFCKQNPLAPSCQLGGGGTGGSSSFSLDYDKLINGMKDAVKLIIDPSETPEFSEFKTEIDDKTSELDSDIDGFMNGSHFDGINDQIGSNPFTDKFQLPSGGGCTAFELGGHPLDLCDAAQKISSVLYFVFSFLTLLHLKHLFFSTITPRKE